VSDDGVWYLDSSAIVKLIVSEPESEALRRFLTDRAPLVTSAIAVTEVNRSVLHLSASAWALARQVLGAMSLVAVGDRVLADAGGVLPARLRTLDAIHLATAAMFGGSLNGLVCYDRRLMEAGVDRGWEVASPR
jgi:predicted nucleic acid-binding protein